ncbi:MAG: helix-turn-helix transcriptional regulator, partial [Ktedonobacterales bacterium]
MNEPSGTNTALLPAGGASDLIATKLVVPPPPAGLVVRPRLTALLDDALRRRVTVLATPPGFGKTTLLSAWLAGQRGIAVAWLALDEHDDDLARFWSYLLAALECAQPGSTGAAAAVLRSIQAPAPATLATALVNALAALPGDLVLVLDDLHVLTAAPVLAALVALVEHQPPRLHLVVASRADPPLPLPRLRARGQFGELRAADLRFTPEEASAFLNGAMGLALAPADATALAERTEGWAAGMQLAALSLRARGDAPAVLDSLSRGNHYILEYLTGEVLDRQPDDLRQFVLCVSVLDRLSASLCDAVTGGANGQRMLLRIRHENLFLQPLDETGEWYRFHALFAEALRRRLREMQPALLPELHARASDWLERAGLLEDAVR